jgi:hypothetical protein
MKLFAGLNLYLLIAGTRGGDPSAGDLTSILRPPAASAGAQFHHHQFWNLAQDFVRSLTLLYNNVVSATWCRTAFVSEPLRLLSRPPVGFAHTNAN